MSPLTAGRASAAGHIHTPGNSKSLLLHRGLRRSPPKPPRAFWGVLLALAFPLGVRSAVAPAPASFTYQGRLQEAGRPANGAYDLRFALFDAPSDGAPLAPPVTLTAVAVSNGLFSVSLDFGIAVFDGASRWLEIAVRANGSAAFTSLEPRQTVTPSPTALFANHAGQALTAAAADSVAPAFWAQNASAGEIIRGVNAAAGTNQWSWSLIPLQAGEGLALTPGDAASTRTATLAIQPGVTNLPTAGTVWVDALNGNDGTAARGFQNRPFRTLPAAFGVLQSGDRLVVRPGSYGLSLVTNTPFALTNAALRLVRLSDVAIEGQRAKVTGSGPGDFLLVYSCTNVTVRGLDFYNDGPGNGLSHLVSVINLNGENRDLQIEDCSFHRYQDHAISHLQDPKSSRRVTIQNCRFFDGGATNVPILGVDGAAISGVGGEWIVRNNHFDNVLRGVEVEGRDIDQKNILIEGNVMTNVWDLGIMVFLSGGGASRFQNNIIANNIIVGTSEIPPGYGPGGILIRGGYYWKVSGNLVSRMRGAWGISLIAIEGDLIGCEVSRNTVVEVAWRGIQLVQPGSHTVADCTVSLNTIRAARDRGILISGQRIKVSDNSVLACTGPAIDLYVQSGPTRDNLVINNFLAGNENGLRIQAGVSNTWIHGNLGVGNTGEDLLDNGSGTVGRLAFLNQDLGDGVPDPSLLGEGVVTVTTDVTLGPHHQVVLAKPPGQSIVVSLPSAGGIRGRRYTVKRLNAGAAVVSLSSRAGELIDGASLYRLTSQYQPVTVISDGANWMVIGR